MEITIYMSYMNLRKIPSFIIINIKIQEQCSWNGGVQLKTQLISLINT